MEHHCGFTSWRHTHVRYRLHQTTYNLDDGSVVEWSPFPLFPAYGKLVGAMSRKKDLRIYEARDHEGMVQIRFETPENASAVSPE